MRRDNAKKRPGNKTDPERHETILDFAVSQSPVIFYVADLSTDAGVTFISANVERITGHKAASFLDDPAFGENHVHPADLPAFQTAIQTLRATGTANREYRFAVSDGDYRWFRDELRLNRDTAGAADELVGSMYDITDQKRAEIQLRDAEALKSAISDAALNAIIVTHEDGTILKFNPVAERTFGYAAETVIGSSFDELVIPAANRPAHRDAMQQLSAGNGDRMVNRAAESEAMRSDGSVFPVEMTATRVTLAGRRVFVIELWDTSERMRAREERERLSRLLHDAVQGIPTGFAIYDPLGHLTLCNAAYATFFGEDPVSMIGTQAADNHRRALKMMLQWDGGPVDLREDACEQSFIKLHDAAGEPIDMQLKDGRWMQITTHPSADGGRIFVRTDITRLKQRETELREAREILEDAMESLAEGFALFDADDRLVMCNQRYRDLNTLSADLLVTGIRWKDLVRAAAERGQYPAAAGQIDTWLEERAKQRAELQSNLEVQQHDGRWHQYSYTRTRASGTVVTRSDISHHKELQRALRESDQQFRRLLEAYPVPVGMTRAKDGTVLYESPAAQALLQRRTSPGKASTAVDHFVNPGDRADYLAALRRDGEVTDYELQLKRSDGSTFWASISARITEHKGEEVIVASIYDLTERRAVEAELDRQKEALHQSEKLGALGALLAGVAHELNNPLSVVVGQALMLQETASDPKTAKRAAKIGNAADRCSRIVRTFLAMARQQPATRSAVDINEIVEATLEVTGYSLRTAGIDVTLDLADDLPDVWADADQLNQVVTNLIVNAQQAMAEASGGGILEISSTWNKAEQTVLLSIKDSGPGIAAEILTRIFEPFFTTKKIGAGTGIGLAVSHKIVESLDGRITVDSEPGKGATFLVALPMAAQNSSAPAEAGKRHYRPRACKVLVIDDEPDVTRMLSDMLGTAGHDVTTADSGQRALKLLSRHEYDVILSDLRMSNMDGPQLYEKLKALSPKLLGRIAFITGDTFSPAVSTFLKETARPYVQKPFTPAEIKDLVGQVLAGESSAQHKR